MKRNQISLRCARCHQLGHNRRTYRSNQRPPRVAIAKGKGKAATTRARARQQVVVEKGYLNSFKFFP